MSLKPGPLPHVTTFQYLAGSQAAKLEPSCDCGYQIAERFELQTPILGYEGKTHDGLAEITRDGVAIGHPGFWLDGVSGIPKWLHRLARRLMRGATVHDILFELMRDEVLPPEAKPVADTVLVDVWNADGAFEATQWAGRKAMETRAAKRAARATKPVILSFP
jgi:hypothetical protein